MADLKALRSEGIQKLREVQAQLAQLTIQKHRYEGAIDMLTSLINEAEAPPPPAEDADGQMEDAVADAVEEVQ